MLICKYIKPNKLPYKIAKDEVFENIKSDIAKFIYKEFMNNGIQVRRNDIVLKDLYYIFQVYETGMMLCN